MADAVADDDVTLPRGNVKMFLLFYSYSATNHRIKYLACFFVCVFYGKKGLFVRFAEILNLQVM